MNDKQFDQSTYRDQLSPICGSSLMEDLDSLSTYIQESQNWARYTVLASILEQIIKSGYSPNELVLGVAGFSEDWGCREATRDLESASSKLVDFLDKKAQSDTGN